MYNCIFTSHCTESFCDKSCPILVETSYLLERNGISMDNPVFRASESKIEEACKLLDSCSGSLGLYQTINNTVASSELLTYCAICRNWQGNRLHCNVYNLKYSKYLDDIKKSWNTKIESDQLEYIRIWSETAKILIISNLDYVNFGDFESQTLLNLIQQRQTNGLTTIFVSPPIHMLVSNKNSQFFGLLKSKLQSAVKVVSR